jgi:hypothetical protein
MPEPAEDVIVRNLIESLERLREDLDRMELWTAALGSFQHPVPDYRPGDQHLLNASPQRPTGQPGLQNSRT